MSWDPKANGVLSAGDEVLRFFGALQDQRERTWPEFRRQDPRCRRCLPGPEECIVARSEVNDHRMIGRPAGHAVKERHGLGAGSIGAQAIDRFGWKGDQPAAPEDLRGATDLFAHSLSGAAFRTASV